MAKNAAEQPGPAINYSFLRIMTGSDLSRRRLACMKADSRCEGPVVWLTGCAHGDEVGGIVVIQEVFKRLRKTPLICGRLRAFPLMNPMGFEVASRHVSIGGEDLNRCFPGNKQGSLAQRIAHVIFDEILALRPTLVLDLHNDWRSSIPYAVIDPPPGVAHRETYAATKAFARQTGLLLIEESRHSPEAQFSHRTLSGSLLNHDVPALTLELGEAFVVNEQHVVCGVRVIWNLLSGLGMVPAMEEPYEYPVPKELRRRFIMYSDELISSTSGIIRFAVQPGDLLTGGQVVAKVYNAFGKLLETIPARRPAIVLGRSDSSVAFPGVPVVALGVIGS